MSVEVLKYSVEVYLDTSLRHKTIITEYHVAQYGFCFNFSEGKLNVFKSEKPRFLSDKDRKTRITPMTQTLQLDSKMVEKLHEIFLKEEEVLKLKEAEMEPLKKALHLDQLDGDKIDRKEARKHRKDQNDSSSDDDSSGSNSGAKAIAKASPRPVSKEVKLAYIKEHNLTPETWIGIEDGKIIGHGDLKSFKKLKLHKDGRMLFQARELISNT